MFTIENQIGKNEKNEKKEQVKELIVGDKFWSLLVQNLGGGDVENIGSVKVIFNSEEKYFKKVMDRLKRREKAKGGADFKNEEMIIGYYSIKDYCIRFNLALEDMGEDLEECIIHELVHLVQDAIDKYPEMNYKMKKLESVDYNESPWEKEAYRLQGKLVKYYRQYCKLIDY